MKQLLNKLPVIAIMFAIIAAFAFKAPASTTSMDPEKGWYLLVDTQNPEQPSSYVFASSYDPDAENCEGSGEICAIYALGDGNEPMITEHPDTDDNVDLVAKRE